METSIFSEKGMKPGPDDIKKALADTLSLWDHLRDVALKIYPPAVEELIKIKMKY